VRQISEATGTKSGMTTDLTEVTQSELEDILSAYNACRQTEDQEFRLVLYVRNELYKKNRFEPEAELIADRATDLVNGYSLRQLVGKDLLEVFIDVDGEESFGLSDLGKEVAETL
jgi:hypothetical protein